MAAVVGGVVRGDRQRRWWFAVVFLLFFLFVFLFSLSPLFFHSLLCFFFFFFFFFFSVFPPSPVLSLLCFFSPRLPCIYRQKKRERKVGVTTVLPPLHRPRDTSPPFSSTRGKLWASGGPWRRMIG
jgi:hypothetical protein